MTNYKKNKTGYIIRYNLTDLYDQGLLAADDHTIGLAKKCPKSNAISLKGLTWLTGSSFEEGCIDIDLRANTLIPMSFLGIAFHGKRTGLYEAVYFRPFNFDHPLRQNQSLQYIHLPDHPFEILRETRPEIFESRITPEHDPKKWFHVHIQVAFQRVSVFINNQIVPALSVHKLGLWSTGMIGLWASGAGGAFNNLMVTHKLRETFLL